MEVVLETVQSSSQLLSSTGLLGHLHPATGGAHPPEWAGEGSHPFGMTGTHDQY